MIVSANHIALLGHTYNMRFNKLFEAVGKPTSGWEKAGDANDFEIDDRDDGYYYHVTVPENENDILEHGLIPGKSRTMAPGGFYAQYSAGKVFFTERSGVSYWASRIREHLEYHGYGEEQDDDQEIDLGTIEIEKTGDGFQAFIEYQNTRVAIGNPCSSESEARSQAKKIIDKHNKTIMEKEIPDIRLVVLRIPKRIVDAKIVHEDEVGNRDAPGDSYFSTKPVIRAK